MCNHTRYFSKFALAVALCKTLLFILQLQLVQTAASVQLGIDAGMIVCVLCCIGILLGGYNLLASQNSKIPTCIFGAPFAVGLLLSAIAPAPQQQ